MTKFKQIVGRGTRVNEEFGKLYFTILDFRNATDNFADPSFDGDITRVKEITESTPADDNFGDEEIPRDDRRKKQNRTPAVTNKMKILLQRKAKASKVYVNNVDVTILNTREMYFDKDGKPVTISLKDFSKQLIHEEFKTLDNFLNMWTNSDRKEAIIKELQEQGIPVHELLEAVNKECDLFDIICHVAFDQPPLTRKERANNVKRETILQNMEIKPKLC